MQKLRATRPPSLRCWVSRARRARRDEQPQPGQRPARVARRGGGRRRRRRGSHARCARPRGHSGAAALHATARRCGGAASSARGSFAPAGLRTLTRLHAPRVAVLGSFAAYMRLVRGGGRSANAAGRAACSFRRRRLQTSLRWASTSSRSTCASPSPSSSPPKCALARRGVALERRTRASRLTPARPWRAGPHPQHRQDGAHVQVRLPAAAPRYAVAQPASAAPQR